MLMSPVKSAQGPLPCGELSRAQTICVSWPRLICFANEMCVLRTAGVQAASVVFLASLAGPI